MNIIRRIKSRFCHGVLVLLFILLVWLCGLFDHLHERSFSQFVWPPYDIDILSETNRILAGEPSRFRLKDNWRLQIIKEPKCRWRNQTSELLIIVKSSISNKKQRDAIRLTWSSPKVSNVTPIVFIVGKSNDADTTSDNMLQEINEYDDLLYVDLIDTYRNNTYKFLHSIDYAYHFEKKCVPLKFLFLVDDDYMVNVAKLLRLVARKDSSQHLYEGWMFNTTPFRFRLHKHAVSLEMYPFDRYPPYISAGAVLLSHKTVTHFYHAMHLVKIYPFDDVYAGILAYLLHIQPTHNKAFVFWTRYVSEEDWLSGDVIAAHGFSYSRLIEEFPKTSQDL